MAVEISTNRMDDGTLRLGVMLHSDNYFGVVGFGEESITGEESDKVLTLQAIIGKRFGRDKIRRIIPINSSLAYAAVNAAQAELALIDANARLLAAQERFDTSAELFELIFEEELRVDSIVELCHTPSYAFEG
jgi:hypothetical protein